MIVIRRAQMAHFADVRRRQDIASLCATLRARYPAQVSSLTALSLFRHVHQALGRAQGYGLYGTQENLDYLGLALRYGWDFDQVPDYAWMHAYLVEPRISAPSARLSRLLKKLQHNKERALLNAQLRAKFALEVHGALTPPRKATENAT